jgi:hypothetical protein
MEENALARAGDGEGGGWVLGAKRLTVPVIAPLYGALDPAIRAGLILGCQLGCQPVKP